ncbi:hypothetical protein V6R93_02085 [Staphylococcus nepalensis]|nr:MULTISPECIES: hypothetical protein [Staphylococcus]MDW8552435.1 hypothetical protein [Staphylococcus nepalensis]
MIATLAPHFAKDFDHLLPITSAPLVITTVLYVKSTLNGSM